VRLDIVDDKIEARPPCVWRDERRERQELRGVADFLRSMVEFGVIAIGIDSERSQIVNGIETSYVLQLDGKFVQNGLKARRKDWFPTKAEVDLGDGSVRVERRVQRIIHSHVPPAGNMRRLQRLAAFAHNTPQSTDIFSAWEGVKLVQ
jgi:hypothetical protein